MSAMIPCLTFGRTARQTLAALILAPIIVIPPASTSRAVAQARRAMTIDDVLDLVQVTNPRISPDGQRVLYVTSELAKWKDNKRTSSIWIVDADGSNARRFLGHDKDRNPAWSPDGRNVAFLSTRDDANNADKTKDDAAAQIWIIAADGGEAYKLTTHKSGIRSFEWTKDSRSIVFLADKQKGAAEKATEKAGDDA